MPGLNDALHVAVSGLQACEARLQKAASNLANLSSVAGRREFVVVTDRVYREFTSPGTATSQAGTINPTGYQVGTGVQVIGNYQSFEMGERIQTQRELDIMIEGEGFFQVAMPDGSIAYSRVGNLQVDNQSRLVMPGSGYPLVPNIVFPQDTQGVTFSPSGEVYAIVNGQQELVGQIETATFFNPAGLRHLGYNMYSQTNASGEADIGAPGTGRHGALSQFVYEGSNVQSVEEIVGLVQIEKDNNAITKVLKTGEEMWKVVNTIGV